MYKLKIEVWFWGFYLFIETEIQFTYNLYITIYLNSYFLFGRKYLKYVIHCIGVNGKVSAGCGGGVGFESGPQRVILNKFKKVPTAAMPGALHQL